MLRGDAICIDRAQRLKAKIIMLQLPANWVP
jgi:hypothetical protein